MHIKLLLNYTMPAYKTFYKLFEGYLRFRHSTNEKKGERKFLSVYLKCWKFSASGQDQVRHSLRCEDGKMSEMLVAIQACTIMLYFKSN